MSQWNTTIDRTLVKSASVVLYVTVLVNTDSDQWVYPWITHHHRKKTRGSQNAHWNPHNRFLSHEGVEGWSQVFIWVCWYYSMLLSVNRDHSQSLVWKDWILSSEIGDLSMSISKRLGFEENKGKKKQLLHWKKYFVSFNFYMQSAFAIYIICLRWYFSLQCMALLDT